MIAVAELETLLPQVVDALQRAADILAARFPPATHPQDLSELLAAIDANDMAVMDGLRASLLAARPGSRWVEDEESGGALPPGEYWVVDPVEGNVNHIHGRPGWGVTATLVCDGIPMLAAVVVPLAGERYTAIRGKGALLNGRPIRVSAKTDLAAAIVGTGQARPGEGAATHARIGASVAAMLDAALLVRMSVPATMELVDVAAGRTDAFWQFSQVRAGLAAGALLVAEAGGSVTDLHGRPWTFASENFLAATPGISAAAAACLSRISAKELVA